MTTILSTDNEGHGFFGTCLSSNWDAPELWTVATDALVRHFGTSPEMARAVLDSRTGRHLADELSFIKGEVNARTVARHLDVILAKKGSWNRTVYSTMKDLAKEGFAEVEPVISAIAKKHLRIETLNLRGRDALDFHDVSVSSLRDALAAAYEAGRKSKN